MIGFRAALPGNEHVPYKYNTGMSNKRIIIPALNLFCQLQMLFGHFKKELDVPAFAVNTDNFFIG